MRKSIRTLAFAAGLTAAIVCARAAEPKESAEQTKPVASSSEASKAEAAAEKAEPRKRNGFPFRGKLGAVDQKAMTLTVQYKTKQRVFLLDRQTRFVKDGKPAKIGDGVAGEEVAGYARKTPEGKDLAVTVRYGSKPTAEGAAPAQASAAKPATVAN